MWKIFRLFLPLLIIGFIAPMIIPGGDGKPVMSVNDWLPDKTTVEKISRAVTDVANKTADIAGEDKPFSVVKKQLYKWKDKQGHWQFTDDIKKVPDYALAQLQAEKIPQAINSMAPPPLIDLEESTASGPSSGAGIDMKKIPQLMEEAKKVRAQMEERNKKLEGI